MDKEEITILQVPQQDLEHCSFFKCKAADVDAWIATLPIANLGQTTRQLYSVLEELNRVRLVPHTRMMVLEKLRRTVHYVSKALSKHYLNQSIVLPKLPRKVADLASTLNLLFATGYKIVAAHAAALGSNDKLISKALHRAVTDLTLVLQRHYQLYEPVSEALWLSLHQYYIMARQNNLLSVNIQDDEFGNGTVEESYIKALLLGCSKPNQLRQEDFNNLYQALNDWAKYCRIMLAESDSIFMFNLMLDKPPVYSTLYDHSTDSEFCLEFDTTLLVEHLNEMWKESTNTSLIINRDQVITISRDLLSHLMLSWGSISKRNFMRIEVNDTLDLCVGLSATHYFVSNKMSLDALIEENGTNILGSREENPFLKTKSHVYRQKDVWDSPYESNFGKTQVSLESLDIQVRDDKVPSPEEASKYTRNNVPLINYSSQGYCVKWPENLTAQLKAGEIIGIKDSKMQNWSIADIRWVNHENQGHTTIGLELISPNASPYGARVIRKKGDPGMYMRVFILPEISVLNRPTTLLTPQVTFAEGQKVTLKQGGQEVQVQLGKRLNSQAGYSLFELSKIGGDQLKKQQTTDDRADAVNDNELESIWKSL
ncbi:MAG: hypothetical protein ACI92E_001800 [Oceanicoccus sp.]|jgi:hypothetical protein